MTRRFLLSCLIAVNLLSAVPLTIYAECLLYQDFDEFPEQIDKVHKTSDPMAGSWWGNFGRPEVNTIVQSEHAREGKAIRMQRATDEPTQTLHCYFIPSSRARLVMKVALYYDSKGAHEGGGMRIAMDTHKHRLFDILIAVDRIEYYDTERSMWQPVSTPIRAVPDRWMEWIIECDRNEGTFSLSVKHDQESKPIVIADDLPLNSQAEAIQKVLEFRAESGGIYYIDDVAVEDE